MKGCKHCGKWPVVFTQRCHPEANTMAVLHENGHVDIICAECQELVISFYTDFLEDTHGHSSIRPRTN